MKYELKHKPSYTLLHLTINPGETIQAEAGAMVYMSPGIEIETKLGSGILSALSRKFLGGESLFLNIFKPSSGECALGLSPGMVGDIEHKVLNGQTIYIQAGSYLCSAGAIDIKPQFGGLKMFLSKESLFLLKISGSGDLFFNSYGAIVPVDINGEYTVDTGHIVAFEDSLSFTIKKVGSWKSTFLSGEGLVCEFKGIGRLWLQSRIPSGFIGWLTKLLPR